MKDKTSPLNSANKNLKDRSSTVDSHLHGNLSSSQSEQECVNRLGSIRKTYHFNFKDEDDIKALTGRYQGLILGKDTEKEIFEYHKLEMIGQGEISDVYKAINLRTQEPFVIKSL